MIHVQTFVWGQVDEGIELARRIARIMAETYGPDYAAGDTALWGVSVDIIDEPQPEEEFEGFHALLEDGADFSLSNHRMRANSPF